MVMSVYFDDAPSEMAQFVRKRFEFQHVRNTAKTLNAVRVNDCCQIAHLVMTGEENGLPIRSFIEFAIGEQRDRALFAMYSLIRECHAGSYGQAVSKRSSRPFDTGHMMTHMP